MGTALAISLTVAGVYPQFSVLAMKLSPPKLLEPWAHQAVGVGHDLQGDWARECVRGALVAVGR